MCAQGDCRAHTKSRRARKGRGEKRQTRPASAASEPQDVALFYLLTAGAQRGGPLPPCGRARAFVSQAAKRAGDRARRQQLIREKVMLHKWSLRRAGDIISVRGVGGGGRRNILATVQIEAGSSASSRNHAANSAHFIQRGVGGA